jgi:hypothetical protein
MGLSLVLLGVFLFLSQINGTQMWEPFMVWWPFILIVLGIEIIAYLFLSKQENPILKYDFVSILFIGVLGTMAIGFTVLISTGIMDEFQSVTRSEEKTFDLPAVEEKLTSDIIKIVIEAGNQPLKIEASSSNELHIFGTYRTMMDMKNQPPIVESSDYMMTNAVGNTLYVHIKEPGFKTGPFSNRTNIEATVIIPQHIQLEVRGDSYQRIELYPEAMAHNWNIHHNGELYIHLQENSDVMLTATAGNSLQQSPVNWDSFEIISKENQDERFKGILKLGEGIYPLNVFNSRLVSVHLAE